MSSGAVLRCVSCGVELAPGMLACPGCRKLVHGARLASLAADAEAAEREGRITDALTHWREALGRLPPGSTQHRAVGETIKRLSLALESAGNAPKTQGGRAKAVAGLGAAALIAWNLKYFLLSLLGKAKLLLSGLASLPTLLSMFAWLALDRSRGLTFALGLVASIYVHEMGHVAALRHYGIQATAPMFIPGLGALVRLRQYPIDAREDARVGLAGPVWGCAAAAVALVAGWLLHERTALAVASLGATINVFNLVPVWQLDGARGYRALDMRQRGIVMTVAAVVALVSGDVMGWVVCAAGGVRLKSDLPAEGDSRAFRTFVGLLVALAAIAWAGGKIGAAG